MHKINSKWIKSTCKTGHYKTQRKTYLKTLSDISYSKIFSELPSVTMKIEAKVNKWDLIKLKILCTTKETTQFISVPFSWSVMSDSVRLHRLQLARLPCPSPTPQMYHPTISSSAVPFSSCSQSFLASGSVPMNQLFATGGQSSGASASASVHPKNIQGGFP